MSKNFRKKISVFSERELTFAICRHPSVFPVCLSSVCLSRSLYVVIRPSFRSVCRLSVCNVRALRPTQMI